MLFIVQLQSCFKIGQIKGRSMSNFQSNICWTWISYLNFALVKNIWQKLEQKLLFIFQPITRRLTSELSYDWLNQRLGCGLNGYYFYFMHLDFIIGFHARISYLDFILGFHNWISYSNFALKKNSLSLFEQRRTYKTIVFGLSVYVATNSSAIMYLTKWLRSWGSMNQA